MKKLYAKIAVPESLLNEREKSIKLQTIFGSVYAPKSKIIVLEIKSTFKAVANNEQTGTAIIVVPFWVFTSKGLNPCQMVHGYLGVYQP